MLFSRTQTMFFMKLLMGATISVLYNKVSLLLGEWLYIGPGRRLLLQNGF